MNKSTLPSAVGILIPAYNESRTIEAVVREAKTVASVVLVVDDGSTDGSANIAEAAGARVLRRERNGGQGKALADGIFSLREIGMNHVITLDGDAAHDPAVAVNLWSTHTESRADITIASRFICQHLLRDIPSHKIAANRFGSNLLSLLLGVDFTDVASGMRVMGPKALSLSLNSTDFGFAFELLWCAVREGLKFKEHSIPVRYDAKDPFWTMQNEIVDFLRVCYLVSEHHPALANKISLLAENIKRFEQFSIRLKGDIYYFHGLPNYRAYMIQLQHSWFLSIDCNDTFEMINFDTI